MGNTPSAQERMFVARSARRSTPANAEHHLHDAVDLASGRIETTVAATLPTPAERVKRLSHLGFEADPSVFDSPIYRLTPQMPYQPSPEAWLDAFDGTYSAGPGVDQIWWRLPSSFATEFMPGCNFSVRQLPAGPCVMSLVFRSLAISGRNRRGRRRHRRPPNRIRDHRAGFADRRYRLRSRRSRPADDHGLLPAGAHRLRVPFNVAREDNHVWQHQPVAGGQERLQRAPGEDPAISAARAGAERRRRRRLRSADRDRGEGVSGEQGVDRRRDRRSGRHGRLLSSGKERKPGRRGSKGCRRSSSSATCPAIPATGLRSTGSSDR